MLFFRKSIPTPVSLSRHYAILGMPSTMLSIFSILTLIVVFIFLQRNELLKELFNIPEHILMIMLWLSSIMAFIILFICAKRPGGIWYRYWNIILFLLNLVVLILYYLPEQATFLFQKEIHYFIQSSWFDVTVCAVVSATFVLLPRLISLSVNSWWLSRISLVSLLLVLSITAFAISFGQKEIIDNAKQEVITTIDKVEKELQIINASDSKLDIETIQPLLFDENLWHHAKILGFEDALFNASQQKIIAVKNKIDELNQLSLEHIADPAIYYDNEKKGWKNNKQFAISAQKIIMRYEFVQKLIAMIKPKEPPLNEQNQKLNALYESQTQQFNKKIDYLKNSWLNAGLYEQLVSQKRLDLADFLKTSVIKGKARYKATNPWQWLSMTLGDAKYLESSHTTGCRFSEYTAKRKEYFRMDCYGYHDFSKEVVVPLVEMRLVYAKPVLNDSTLPSELYYIFPIPKKKDAEEYRTHVINIFIAGIKAENPDIRVRNTRSSAKDGVSLKLDGQKINIVRLQRKNYFKRQDMIELRIVKK